MWTVEPEDIWKKPRRAGISGFMRLRNEAQFLDRVIATHLPALDELVIVHNGCTDESPEIGARWQRQFPNKVTVYEYEPKVLPVGTPEARALDFRSPHSFANQSNYALAKTNYRIAVKVDGDHLAVPRRYRRICNVVRRRLTATTRYPIYGLNLTLFKGLLGIYNFYNFSAVFPEDVIAGATPKIGPPPFTSGDHYFFPIDPTTYYTTEPVEGLEHMHLPSFSRSRFAPFTYSFFHMKGMKDDKGAYWERSENSLRQEWSRNVSSLAEKHVSSLKEMRFHNPIYFRGANLKKDLQESRATFAPWLPPRDGIEHKWPLKERVSDLWYSFAYP